jgi:hypothetical protein
MDDYCYVLERMGQSHLVHVFSQDNRVRHLAQQREGLPQWFDSAASNENAKCRTVGVGQKMLY